MIPEKIEVNIAGDLEIPLPPMTRVLQRFDSTKLADIPSAICQEFQRAEIRDRVKPGQIIFCLRRKIRSRLILQISRHETRKLYSPVVRASVVAC